jgi:hypothetical protein
MLLHFNPLKIGFRNQNTTTEGFKRGTYIPFQNFSTEKTEIDSGRKFDKRTRMSEDAVFAQY